MSKHSTREHVNIWKKVPHRIKGLLKKDTLFDPTSPPPSLTNYTKQKTASSLIYRIFSTRHKNKTIIKLKEHQWDNPPTDVNDLELYATAAEVPMRASLMSFFNPSQHPQSSSLPLPLPLLQSPQHGWPNNAFPPDEFNRIYMETLLKIRLFSHYSMEQQIVIHHMLTYIQNQQQKTLLYRGVYQRDFSSVLSGRSMMADSILMNNNRKPRRTRYIFMLLSTPAARVANKIHPVTNALSKLRKPYAETYSVIQASSSDGDVNKNSDASKPSLPPQEPLLKSMTNNKTCDFVPADYLLDPDTLFCSGNIHASNRTKHIIGSEQNAMVAQ